MYEAAVKVFGASGSAAIQSGLNQACGTSCNQVSLGTIFHQVADILIFVVGAVSVIMIIIGGLRYVISNGDSKATGDAKNTILYAVIGLVVAIASWGIVSFVNTNFAK
jgi:Type IV secretion system pilin